MKIIVCIKPSINSSDISYDLRSGAPVRPAHTMLSEAEWAALQTALDKKNQYDAHVTVLSVADESANPLLYQALRAGANRAVRLWHLEDGEPLDTYAAATAAAAATTTLAADLVICATRSADLGSGFFPAAIAAAAHFELISGVLSLSFKNGVFDAVQKLDGGWRAAHRVQFPAVIAVEPEITRIRHNTVLGRTYRVGLAGEVETWTPEMVGLAEMPRSLLREMDLSLPRIRARVASPGNKRVSSMDLLRRKNKDGAESKQTKLVGTPESVAEELLGLFGKWQA
ncbi:protein of unknown function [Georgfuchsia toluolica]|uniref:Electron transfer flavoprotein alpha/beta-subunit N-terminal domain-containing protein n=1 Tax=Georgfuchsia toluolica TaxID=424218 RepID=A0A916J6E2_9PROT|nr:hypothetical protein [Georgfuchsia toluolica]CAG4884792.1 protein of unknown function [Georgfuchsia toluolica]